ncbi:MAG: AAA family ATPase [Saprospiraceae bacterium]|nr:AAA family ATPase [Saprospiraceae bacterium]
MFNVIKEIIKNCEGEYINQGLISDDPIESDEENDRFARKDYAKSIVSEIRKTVNKRAFNIAVTGAWGSGKTSFLNLIKGEMDREVDDKKVKFITVNYNPWDFKEDKIIGLDLLKTISHELANEKELQEKFKGLMVSLQGVDENPWYKVIPNLLIGFSTEKSINEYREEIGKALKDQNKKLVIFLDDLDRLDGDEILEVFKTIRNSFDIANTFFILGFDIDYVADQIEGKVKGKIATDRAVEYLDKIFQMRLFMPSNSDYSYYK